MGFFKKLQIRNSLETVAPELAKDWGNRMLFETLTEQVVSGRKDLVEATQDIMRMEREFNTNKRVACGDYPELDLGDLGVMGFGFIAEDEPRRATMADKRAAIEKLHRKRRFGR